MVKHLAKQLSRPRSEAVNVEGSKRVGTPMMSAHNVRFTVLLMADLCLVCLALMGSSSLGYDRPLFPANTFELLVLFGMVSFAATVFVGRRLYRSLIRHMGPHAVWDLVGAVTIVALGFALLNFYWQLNVAPAAPGIFWLLLFFGTGGVRLLTRAYYQASSERGSRKVLIYGAGESGRQLLHALNHGANYEVYAFVDDDTSLRNTVINGRPVFSSKSLETLVREQKIAQVLLAVPSASPERRREIINALVGIPVHVRTVPKISELVGGRASVNQIQDVDLDDLLGRDPVPPHPELIDSCLHDKVVMVTGAGGSIGSELCRQIMASAPRELILLDISEFALYNIEQELRALCHEANYRFPVVTLLGSVRDERRLEALYKTFNVQTVYHAAAYKHVPLVEYNVAEGVANNVEGTWSAARAAERAGVETFVLVSTDKAVRPANIMGASKRFAELIVQGLAQRETPTRFCIVRFGNVLGSSGSVVPLFREQIECGGPVTVTHPDVSRYFMSITEAAQLVLQTGAMGTGGDVFVLDMGEPVRIVDLARRMIRLSGYELEGDALASDHIDIEFIGLRPGEKLHEELLLGTSVAGTGHPMIMRAEEDSLDFDVLEVATRALIEACGTLDCDAITKILRNYVSGFDAHEVRHDFVWLKQGRVGKRARQVAQAENVSVLPVNSGQSVPKS
ncbi:predicted nucleoside-diphosphate sugar epimerase [marine gamma proteobacterium HTCC2080]|jgi:FlaA1/EpsC-like NDP-sugar epimerase|nr:predicted nucleoside-diphosphate sugar epimerase [marine gamma proteobacterium HTCC2080]